MSKRCPFCNARYRRYNTNEIEHIWSCGTIGPDKNDEYNTGSECDKTVFREGFLRCHDLLVRVVDGSIPMYPKNSGDFVIPRELMLAILEEMSK